MKFGVRVDLSVVSRFVFINCWFGGFQNVLMLVSLCLIISWCMVLVFLQVIIDFRFSVCWIVMCLVVMLVLLSRLWYLCVMLIVIWQLFYLVRLICCGCSCLVFFRCFSCSDNSCVVVICCVMLVSLICVFCVVVIGWLNSMCCLVQFSVLFRYVIVVLIGFQLML